MGKYFGTDGVRGVANQVLTPELAFRIGRCGGYVLTGQAEHRPKVVIGMDTRISGLMLEASLIAGLLSIGVDVIRLGVVSTPAVAFLTRQLGADAGVMISASHNPVADNGIKFFAADGYKLLDETEAAIEQLLEQAEDTLPRPTGAGIGSVTNEEHAATMFIDYLKSTIHTSFAGLKIVLDCAHGAASTIAPAVFEQLGAEVIAIGASPNGLNINEGVGSTHPEYLREEVIKHNANIGLAFDGDADRLIAIDELGEEVDGDYILLILADAMRAEGTLANNTVVTTVMSNIGFFKATEKLQLQYAQTAVGDRYVMEEMRRGGYTLGGEQSGHVIMLDYNTTGDGVLSALHLVSILVKSGKQLSELKSIMRKYPQLLVNVKVADKSTFKDNAAIAASIASVEQQLGSDGRVLVRASGTENLIRVMVEGPDEIIVEKHTQHLASVVREQLGSTY